MYLIFKGVTNVCSRFRKGGLQSVGGLPEKNTNSSEKMLIDYAGREQHELKPFIGQLGLTCITRHCYWPYGTFRVFIQIISRISIQ
jgi:hypothetical protein